MEIRRARPADGPAFLDLVRSLAEFEKLAPPDAAAGERLLRDAFCDRPPFELWVTEVGGAVVAYAVTFTTYSTFLARPGLYLEDLFVRPDCRGGGIGTAMLARLRQVAEERGHGRFEWTVLDWNTQAQRLYTRFGAELLGQWLLVRMTLPVPSE